MKVLCKLLSALQMLGIIIDSQLLPFRVWWGGDETGLGSYNEEAPLVFKTSYPVSAPALV